jgi:LysR family nitrogen assimilation transcriptional regulator
LLLTSDGEQMLAMCRRLLDSAEAVTESARTLRKGTSGVLKVAASPQHIESVFSGLLPRFASSFPEVKVHVREGTGREILDMLERGEIHLAQNLLHLLKPDLAKFSVQPLGFVDVLAACHPDQGFGSGRTVELARLTKMPLLLLDVGFGFRRAFDAACRLAHVEPVVHIESRSPHTLLALAAAGQGIAVIPSALRTERSGLRIYAVAYRRKLLRQSLSILWDKRRLLPSYAAAFRKMWVDHVDEIFPITQPTAAARDACEQD